MRINMNIIKSICVMTLVLCFWGAGIAEAGFGDGLVGYWPMDEGSGVTTEDASSNSNDGTIYGGAAWSTGKFGSAKVLLKPAAPGTGVIAGSSLRAVVEACGLNDILTKSLGTKNPYNVLRATFEGLHSLQDVASVALRRGVSAEALQEEVDR